MAKVRALRVIGAIMLIIIILVTLPFIAPKWMGYQLFEVISDSMEPAIKTGSVVYVKEVSDVEILEDDVITFFVGEDQENIITHRVIEIDEDNGFFITKGDNNDTPDRNPVEFNHLIGRVDHVIAGGVGILNFERTIMGKIAIGIWFAIILALWMISDIIQKRLKQDEKVAIEAEAELESDEPKAKPKKKWDGISIALMVCGIGLVVFAGANLLGIFNDYHTSNKLYSDIEEEYVVANANIDQVAWYDMINVDFASLKAQNSDVVGWIYFENDDISYPIMYSGDNDYYLHRSLDKSNATAGSIFLEGGNTPDFEDYHTIIYGHNMRNLSMFGKLKNYNRDSSYYNDHQYFQVLMDGKKYRYHIFAYETVSQASDIYSIGYIPDDRYQSFIAQIVAKSQLPVTEVPANTDKIVTLSTCSTNGATYRFVVCGVRVDEYPSAEGN